MGGGGGGGGCFSGLDLIDDPPAVLLFSCLFVFDCVEHTWCVTGFAKFYT